MYQNFYNPYQQPQRTEIVKVSGEAGAQAFAMAPNSSALLLDITAPLVWLVQTDGAGYKTMAPYQISEYKKPEEPNVGLLEERIKRLEEMLKNGKSNDDKTEQRQEWNAGED